MNDLIAVAHELEFGDRSKGITIEAINVAIAACCAGKSDGETFTPDAFRGVPIKATLPECWPEPYRVVYEGDPIHQGWTMFGGMPRPRLPL